MAEIPVPRDAVFFLIASATLAAALQPASFYPSDREQATTAGQACARLLDSGLVPIGFVPQRFQTDLREADQYAQIQRATRGEPVGGESWNAGQVQRAQAKFPHAPMGREQILQKVEAAIARISDLSEPVRDAALRAAALRLASRPDLTGARLDEALQVVFDETERALELAQGLVPARSFETENAAGNDITALNWPYPLNVLVAVGAMAQDETDRGHESPIDRNARSAP